ncbi:UNVERIFIED_CONTAM: hypothetical protein FKN15_017219 [Acipenser sinensis]
MCKNLQLWLNGVGVQRGAERSLVLAEQSTEESQGWGREGQAGWEVRGQRESREEDVSPVEVPEDDQVQGEDDYTDAPLHPDAQAEVLPPDLEPEPAVALAAELRDH